MENRFETFTSLILQINRSIQRIKSIEMTAFGLKGIHAMCLFYLSRNASGLTQAELARLCLEDKASVSRALAELKRRELVTDTQPTQEKKYNAKLSLTGSGKKIAQQVLDKALKALDIGAEGISVSDREALYKYLERINDNLETYVREVRTEGRSKREKENGNGG